MGDPQCEKISADPDYSGWGRLLGTAYKEAYYAGGSTDNDACEADGCGDCEKLLILGGDLVNHGDTDLEWNGFFGAGGELLKKMKVITPTGNHEKRADSGYETVFDLPANGPAGYEQRFYSYEYGCCHFTVLDTNYMGQRNAEAKEFISGWIKKDLGASKKDITVVVMHHPMYTVGTSLDDEIRAENMRSVYLPLFEEYGVDMILCGHQHLYCRTKEDLVPVMQIMGVSGTKHYCGNDFSYMACKAENVATATIFEADSSNISFKTIDVEGNVLDRGSLCPKRKQKGSFAVEKDGDPLRPGYEGMIEIINGRGERTVITESELGEMQHIEEAYSVTRGRNTKTETVTGVKLADLLKKAGTGEENIAIITAEDGNDVAAEVHGLMNRYRFAVDESGEVTSVKVPSIVFREDVEEGHSPFRLMIGQSRAGECNGRYRPRNIVRIELMERKNIDIFRNRDAK